MQQPKNGEADVIFKRGFCIINVLRQNERSIFLESGDKTGHDRYAFGRQFGALKVDIIWPGLDPILTLTLMSCENEYHQQTLLPE